MSSETPLMKQYQAIKAEYPDCILFFRLGDFYEMFDEDAKVASSILQIALTTRDKGKKEPIPMCGVPHFAAEGYITKLINAGYKVAICEQVEDPKQAKGIVKREVVRVITPGTHTPSDPKENNFIMSIYPSGRLTGIAIADLSTGEFSIYETERDIKDEVQRFEPKEVLCPESLKENLYYREALEGVYVSFYDEWSYEYTEAYRSMLEYYKVYSLEAFGIEEYPKAVSAAGALIQYLRENQKDGFVLSRPELLNQGQYMFLDAYTKKNLELLRNLRDGTTEGTLLKVLDETLTPMGGRFLRQAIMKPLVELNGIHKRLDAVENLFHDLGLQETLRTYLRRLQDLERLSTKVLQGSANARDLIAIKHSLSALPFIKKALQDAESERLRSLCDSIGEFSQLEKLIEEAIVDDPPTTVKEGGIIKDGFRKDVDELREIAVKGKDYIASLERKERERTGIQSLKIGYNKVFGYYIEVTKANLHLVPKDYIRKQTLVSGERFVTEELKAYEDKVLGAEERLKVLEYEVFQKVLHEVKKYADRLLETATAVAELDFLLSLAVVARRNNYVKPLVDDSYTIEIIDGRHPVLEKAPLTERFIPNSIYMDNESHRLLVITGPNMAGKSTYMRQVALIVLMAQMGSFVPATEARIGLVDRIFTRIGASDFISRGQSTFMVEMIETANILHNATDRSLILLDEVGRGTSTFDGISIAWAVAEYILKTLKARTLFATHYHELTELSIEHEGVRNYNVAVKEWGDEIIFLRKVEKGPADKSYGIHVARLAGLPEGVIERAKEVLQNLEKAEFTAPETPRMSGRRQKKPLQLDLFAVNYEPLIEKLLKIDTSELSPEKALLRLKELKRLAEELSTS
jgi:DNA mismatch repair protein MutS